MYVHVEGNEIRIMDRAIMIVPRYVAKIVGRVASSYYGYSPETLVERLRKLADELASTPYDEWPEWYRETVPRAYVYKLTRYWLPIVADFINYVKWMEGL